MRDVIFPTAHGLSAATARLPGATSRCVGAIDWPATPNPEFDLEKIIELHEAFHRSARQLTVP